MYDNVRMFYTNLLAEATPITYSATSPGIVSGIIKNGGGSATMTAYDDSVVGGSNGYNYYNNLLYTIEIDDVSAGKSVTQATFKWRTNETSAGSWEETGVTTATSATNLSPFVWIKFATGTGDDFELGDTFSFWGKASYTCKFLADGRRDTLWQGTAAISKIELEWDFGAPVTITCAGLFDAYFEIAPVSVTIRGGATSAIEDFSQAFVVTDPHSIGYFNETYQYWGITIQFSGAKSAAATQFFLGTYTEFPAGAMYNWGSSERLVSEMADSAVPDFMRRIIANRRELTLKWQNVHTDYRSYFDNLYAATRQAADGMEHPVFVHLDPTDDGETLYWMKLVNDLDREWTDFQRDTINLQLREVAPNYAL